MAEIKQTFFQECEDLLEELESGLLEMESGGADPETVNAVFRAVHSIKGGAGAFGLDDLVKFAHTFETTLDEVRSDRLEVTPEISKVFLRSGDVLADLVRAARDETDVDEGDYAPLLKELTDMVGGDAGGAMEEEIDFNPVGLDFDFGDAEMDGEEIETPRNEFAIKFRPKKALYASANDPMLILRELAEIGDIELTCQTDAIPLLDEIDPEGAYISWDVHVSTEHEGVDVWDVFEFVDGDCVLEITPLNKDDAGGGMTLIEFDDDDDDDTPIDALSDELEPASDDEKAPEAQSAAPEEPKATATETAATDKAKSGGAKAAAPQATVRVDLDRVDRLINLVGELVINQAMLSQCVSEVAISRGSTMETSLDELKQLTREIQESVMAIRAQPVKTLFQRMSRIVREAAAATDKSVRLVTEGEATEVDKTVIERLADPLTHMIRNAVDHGLEMPDKREEAGKEAQGEVRLSAAHRSGRVIIEISDNGAGIHRERVKQIAIDKGLIPADAKLSDSEIDNLIFMPGFSTAKEVSNLSGRGVGMDVVKRSITSLGGKVSIASTPGEGSIFTISLPLTMAILDGMVVQVADETLVVPLTAIVETWKPAEADIHHLGSGAQVISIRGEFIPLIDVGYELGYRQDRVDAMDRVIISVENNLGSHCALVVDDIQDQRQVVIKSLEENYGNVPSIAAATILGDGRIALILDVDAISSLSGSVTGLEELSLAATG